MREATHRVPTCSGSKPLRTTAGVVPRIDVVEPCGSFRVEQRVKKTQGRFAAGDTEVVQEGDDACKRLQTRLDEGDGISAVGRVYTLVN